MSTKANIVIEQGTDFNTPIELTDINGEDLDVTNFTVQSKLRKYYNSQTTWPFDTLLANGSLTLSMSAVASANLAPGRYVYDIVLTNTVSNTVSRLIEGIATVTPSVTR